MPRKQPVKQWFKPNGTLTNFKSNVRWQQDGSSLIMTSAPPTAELIVGGQFVVQGDQAGKMLSPLIPQIPEAGMIDMKPVPMVQSTIDIPTVRKWHGCRTAPI